MKKIICTIIILLFGHTFASGFNAGVGINYLGFGVELEYNLNEHNALVFGLGGFPLPGAGFVGLETPRWGGSSGAIYLGHKYLFKIDTNSAFLTARFGFHSIGGSFGGFSSATASANIGYRFFEIRFLEQTGYYLDLELGAFLARPEGVGYYAAPTVLLNIGYLF